MKPTAGMHRLQVLRTHDLQLQWYRCLQTSQSPMYSHQPLTELPLFGCVLFLRQLPVFSFGFIRYTDKAIKLESRYTNTNTNTDMVGMTGQLQSQSLAEPFPASIWQVSDLHSSAGRHQVGPQLRLSYHAKRQQQACC